jgi:hypothetical protein
MGPRQAHSLCGSRAAGGFFKESCVENDCAES